MQRTASVRPRILEVTRTGKTLWPHCKGRSRQDLPVCEEDRERGGSSPQNETDSARGVRFQEFRKLSLAGLRALQIGKTTLITRKPPFLISALVFGVDPERLLQVE